ncbi:hypothetical protein [Burkholderia sp. Ac-20344]|uniref:hypothetical protein n=1 Tax=Burkholderia sp. Ac-20344 TaxID=2703890 RepID=UPI00197BE191|nr:hypothetical protein [Burkholderia sp. Ac-20344]MBN3832628.1 hypothetical protein [Burkholderia sp. Ac-20344]
MVAWTTDPATPRDDHGGRPVEAGLSTADRPPTIDDMLREPKEKLMRYAKPCIALMPIQARSPVCPQNLLVLAAFDPAAESHRIENR